MAIVSKLGITSPQTQLNWVGLRERGTGEVAGQTADEVNWIEDLERKVR